METGIKVGIVEDRNDPLFLGRYRVRVFSVHSESTTDVPTSSLPWAIPLSIGASISGIGASARYTEGSLVFVFFQDGESLQQPIILGSAHGVPIDKGLFGTLMSFTDEKFIMSNSSSTVAPEQVQQTSTVATVDSTTTADTSGTPVVNATVQEVAPIDFKAKLKAALAFRESSNDYTKVNQLGYLGKYQFGALKLIDMGYVKQGTRNSDLKDPSFWFGKNGIKSREDFLARGEIQEQVMDESLRRDELSLRRMSVITNDTTEQEKAGFLAASHLVGTGGCRDMKNGKVKKDGNGVSANHYYDMGYAAVAGAENTVAPQNTTIDNPARQKSVNPSVGKISSDIETLPGIGFIDPNGKFPRYLNEQDTNRLARNQNIDKTVVQYKEETLDRGVVIANGKGTWDQSPVPYNTTYPFNDVYESESGHLLEFDDSPDNERIHLYHTSGTFQEIDRNGTEVRKIIGDKYEIWERNGYVHIKGSVNITVEGNANILVANDCELEVDGNFNAQVTGNASWSVGGEWKVKSGGNMHQSSGGGFAVDASTVDLNSGISSAGSLPSPSRGAVGLPTLEELIIEPRGFNELSDFESDDMTPEQAKARQNTLSEKGLIDSSPIEGTENVEKTETIKTDEPKTTTPVECGAFVSGAININDFISTNFRLKDLTKGMSIPQSQQGIKDTELACNLKNLAVNVLEHIKKMYPDMIITSGLRPMGSNPRSQHPLGQAADLQFPSHKSGEYIDIAKAINASVPTDQLILEYRTSKRVNGVPTTWIHVSFSTKGNRNQVFTMDNDVRISEFGQLKVIV